MKRSAAIIIAYIFALALVIQGCSHAPAVRDDGVESQNLEEQYEALKEKALLQREQKRNTGLGSFTQKQDPQKTADYLFRKGVEYETTDTFKSYDYFREFTAQYPHDPRFETAQEKMKGIEKTNFEKISADVAGRQDLREKITILEQHILDYNSYLDKEDLKRLQYQFYELKIEYETAPEE